MINKEWLGKHEGEEVRLVSLMVVDDEQNIEYAAPLTDKLFLTEAEALAWLKTEDGKAASAKARRLRKTYVYTSTASYHIEDGEALYEVGADESEFMPL